MPLKPQDLLVSLHLALLPGDRGWTYAQLAAALEMSDSEANSAVRRSGEAGLLTPERGRGAKPRPVRGALLEFIEHGVRFAFYASPAEQTRGVPTAYSARPLNQLIESGSSSVVVWPDAKGKARGQALAPLYPTVPSVARRDWRLYEVLALVDAVRIGRARERKLACKELRNRLVDGDA